MYMKGDDRMSAPQHDVFIQRFTALFNEPNLSIANEIFAPGFKSHVPLAPELDCEGWKAYVQNFLTGFPDLFMDVHETVATVDRVVRRVTYRGTHTGVFQGVPPSGKAIACRPLASFEWRMASVWRIGASLTCSA
jgi:predicted ester cyclase